MNVSAVFFAVHVWKPARKNVLNSALIKRGINNGIAYRECCDDRKWNFCSVSGFFYKLRLRQNVKFSVGVCFFIFAPEKTALDKVNASLSD